MPRAATERQLRCGAIALALAFALGSDARAQAFVDVTESAAVSYLQHTGNPFPSCLVLSGAFCTPERMSGGAAVADVDGDGDLDLYVTRLEGAGLLFCNRLVESGEATFEDCSEAAGLASAGENGNGAAFGDLDGDGDPDLYLSAIATTRFYLFVNDGAGHFTEEGVARGAAVATSYTHLGTGVELGDYDGDGWLDVHVDEWGSYTLKTLGSIPDQPVHMRLLRNRGAAQPGYFEDRTAQAGVTIADDEAWGFSSAFRDLDGDGRLDLAIASDFGTSKLFWNDGDGTFTEGGAAAGVATDENGMGSTLGDADGDGDLDWFVTSIYDPDGPCPQHPVCPFGSTGNRFYRNDGDRHFSDQTGDAVTGLRDGGWGWGTAFFDYDLDGDLDLVMTNGVDYPDTDSEDAYHADPMRLWRNDGGGAWTEVAVSEGVTETRPGNGLLVFDYDADGDLDLFVVNDASTPVLYQNQTIQPGAPHWLRVRVVGEAGADLLGATVTLRPVGGGGAQVRTIGSTTHFLAWSDPAAHFGLGASTAAVDVEVRRPGGATTTQRVSGDALDATLVVPEPVAGGGCALALLAVLRRARSVDRKLQASEAP
jgi:hypothetical protein